jgi:hypothetical protein
VQPKTGRFPALAWMRSFRILHTGLGYKLGAEITHCAVRRMESRSACETGAKLR